MQIFKKLFQTCIGLKNADIAIKNIKKSFLELQLDTFLKHFQNFDFNISGTSNLSIWRTFSDCVIREQKVDQPLSDFNDICVIFNLRILCPDLKTW